MDRKRSEVLYSLLGIQNVAEVVTGEAWQIEMVWASEALVRAGMIGCRPIEM